MYDVCRKEGERHNMYEDVCEYGWCRELAWDAFGIASEGRWKAGGSSEHTSADKKTERAGERPSIIKQIPNFSMPVCQSSLVTDSVEAIHHIRFLLGNKIS